MSNDLTPIPDNTPARKRLELPVFPVHKVNEDGTLAELTPKQWASVQTNIVRLDGVRNIAHDAMFALADLMANERDRHGEDDRAFGQYLKAHKVEVERNELTAMTSWWRRRTQEQRDAAMVYAMANGIARMVTLQRHFQRMEVSERRTIDVQATVVPAAPKAIDAPEPTPVLNFAQQALKDYPAPKGIHHGDLTKVLNLIGSQDRTWRLAKALHKYLLANPALLERVLPLDGEGA